MGVLIRKSFSSLMLHILHGTNMLACVRNISKLLLSKYRILIVFAFSKTIYKFNLCS